MDEFVAKIHEHEHGGARAVYSKRGALAKDERTRTPGMAKSHTQNTASSTAPAQCEIRARGEAFGHELAHSARDRPATTRQPRRADFRRLRPHNSSYFRVVWKFKRPATTTFKRPEVRAPAAYAPLVATTAPLRLAMMASTIFFAISGFSTRACRAASFPWPISSPLNCNHAPFFSTTPC